MQLCGTLSTRWYSCAMARMAWQARVLSSRTWLPLSLPTRLLRRSEEVAGGWFSPLGPRARVVGFPSPYRSITWNESCSGPYLLQPFHHLSDSSCTTGEGGWRAEMRLITTLSLVKVQSKPRGAVTGSGPTGSPWAWNFYFPSQDSCLQNPVSVGCTPLEASQCSCGNQAPGPNCPLTMPCHLQVPL